MADARSNRWSNKSRVPDWTQMVLTGLSASFLCSQYSLANLLTSRKPLRVMLIKALIVDSMSSIERLASPVAGRSAFREGLVQAVAVVIATVLGLVSSHCLAGRGRHYSVAMAHRVLVTQPLWDRCGRHPNRSRVCLWARDLPRTASSHARPSLHALPSGLALTNVSAACEAQGHRNTTPGVLRGYSARRRLRAHPLAAACRLRRPGACAA